MNTPPSASCDFAETVAIAGVGLIGGSIALALKHRGFPGRVLGLGRNALRLKAAEKAGLIDGYAEQPKDLAADLWIFCTPVDRIVSGVLDVHKDARRTVLITDAGSVKREICAGIQGHLPQGMEFIGSHPLAGSEQRGFEHADANLFAGRLCVVTPEKSTSKEQLSRLHSFWKFLGMRIVEMDAACHDKALAETSHLPHLVASALAGTVEESNAHLAATGFADTTRIASGDPELWTAIFLQNTESISQALAKFTDHLAAFRDALGQKDADALHHLLQTAKAKRDQLKKSQ